VAAAVTWRAEGTLLRESLGYLRRTRARTAD